MGIPILSPPSLILPTYYVNGTEVENIEDLVEHTSREIYIADVQEKEISIVAIEVVTVAAPGALWFWVELSPVRSVTSAAYWAAIGGGGGAQIPLTPVVIAGTGVNGAAHTEMIGWTLHSYYARAVVQTPVNAGLPGDYWQVQVHFSGKG